jgi:hypothetical protein
MRSRRGFCLARRKKTTAQASAYNEPVEVLADGTEKSANPISESLQDRPEGGTSMAAKFSRWGMPNGTAVSLFRRFPNLMGGKNEPELTAQEALLIQQTYLAKLRGQTSEQPVNRPGVRRLLQADRLCHPEGVSHEEL